MEAPMPLTAEPLHPLFAARVTGLDMTRPLTPDLASEVCALMDRYAVCVYPNATPLTNEQHIAFARALGPMQRGRVLVVTGRQERLGAWPELVDVGNLSSEPRDLFGAERAYRAAERRRHRIRRRARRV
jgi:alpha-ketoglutarate-dependent 2,4-dichlorophenoxyacetate dioxygenase